MRSAAASSGRWVAGVPTRSGSPAIDEAFAMNEIIATGENKQLLGWAHAGPRVHRRGGARRGRGASI